MCAANDDLPAQAEDLYGSILLSPPQVQALVRTIEGALALRHSAQFFVWTQGSLQQLLPHQLLLCGAYQRSHRELGFELFNSVPLPQGLPEALLAPGATLPRRLQALWLEQGRGRPLLLPAAGLGLEGFAQLLLHGVSRPQRPSEIESFFALAHGRPHYGARQGVLLELLTPHLHSGWLRASGGAPPRVAAELPAPLPPAGLTGRECQVLHGLREGHSNQRIAEDLAISALTVKNHVQRILRKLGASNRAHAVARAMALRLLDEGSATG
ncbi:MAG TPA: helix-turn-helix transcriptional regulator [Roseateles sp.]|nr:helix-turn-helix transcriptional regulator [Roseateles sp.]